MWSVLSAVLGGVGLFLLGMTLMTDGLKALAGDSLRGLLARFTGNRLSAVATGAAVTAVVQSSSATTLATIGFVSAGLLGFGNAVGVILGANLGTTSTGWLVGLLGLKLSVGKLLLPFIGLGALARLMGRGRLAQVGTAVAGFGVIFVGIDLLQAGMQELSDLFKPEDFPRTGLGARALLVLIGAAMTVVMQSSSAAVATTLAALSTGAIDLRQAAALVVGQNVGTTVTAGIAAIGATAAAKRTAAVHVLFNLGTGLVAFVLLGWLVEGIDLAAKHLWAGDGTLTLAAFHTAFNLIGLVIFLPASHRLAELAMRLIPERRSRFVAWLDPTLVGLPAVALEAIQRAQALIAAELFRVLAGRLRRAPETGPELLGELDLALDEVRHFLARLPPPERQGSEFQRQISALHLNEHLERLIQDAQKVAHGRELERMESLAASARGLADMLAGMAGELGGAEHLPDEEAIRQFSQRLADERRSSRPAILEATAQRRMDPDEALALLAAQRWIDRLAYHAWRVGHHFRAMQGVQAAASPADPAAPPAD